MAADELGGGVNNDVCAVLQRADQVRGAEGVIHNNRQAVLVGDLCDSVQIGDISVGVAQGFQVDQAGVLLDGILDLFQVVGIHKGSGDAKVGQGMLQQVVAAAVNGLLGNHMAAVLGQGLDGVADSGSTGSNSQASHAAFQGSDALFQHILGGVGQTAVNVAGIGQAKAGSCVGRVVKYVRSGLINGNGAGAGSRIGLFLANMKLKRFKMQFVLRHCNYLQNFAVNFSYLKLFGMIR